MQIFILVGLMGLVAITGYSLWKLLSFRRGSPESHKDQWKYDILLIGLGFLFFFIFLNATMQSIQLEDTITSGAQTFVVKNNDYVMYYSFLPYASAAVVMNFVFNAGLLLKNLAFFGRGRLKPSRRL